MAIVIIRFLKTSILIVSRIENTIAIVNGICDLDYYWCWRCPLLLILVAVRVDLVLVRLSAGQGQLGSPLAFFVQSPFLIFEFLEALLIFRVVSLAYSPLLLLSSYQELNQINRSPHRCKLQYYFQILIEVTLTFEQANATWYNFERLLRNLTTYDIQKTSYLKFGRSVTSAGNRLFLADLKKTLKM